jgi:hypothetical protein
MPTVPFTFLFLATDVHQVMLSANTTALFFVIKQLLKSFLQPQHSQLLQPRYQIREEAPPLAPLS